MGFNIGRFIGSIAPAVGSIFGPAGTAVGLGVSAALAPSSSPAQAATVGRATQPGPVSIGPTANQQFQGGGFGPTSVVPQLASLGRLPSVIRDIGTGIGLSQLPALMFGDNGKNPISVILAKARAATGGPVTRNKIIDAAKACGLDLAAGTFGLDVKEVCLVVVRGRTRRRRGVSAADIRRTKRTIGFASKIRKDLKVLAR